MVQALAGGGGGGGTTFSAAAAAGGTGGWGGGGDSIRELALKVALQDGVRNSLSVDEVLRNAERLLNWSRSMISFTVGGGGAGSGSGTLSGGSGGHA